MADPTSSDVKCIYEFNKSDPTYSAGTLENGGVHVYLKSLGPVFEFESMEEFKRWAFEGGDSV